MNEPALLETVKQVFSDENWAFAEVPDREVIQAGFEAENARVELHVQAFPELSAVSVVSEVTVEAGTDPVHRERLAELIMRTNQQLTVGNFEMDWDAGRVLFRVTNVFSDETGDPVIILGLVHTTILEMDRLMPFLSVISRSEGAALVALDIPELICDPSSASG